MACGGSPCLVLGDHYGDFNAANRWFDKAMAAMRRAASEPDIKGERRGLLAFRSCYGPYALRANRELSLLETAAAVGIGTWDESEALLDQWAATETICRLRGNHEPG